MAQRSISFFSLPALLLIGVLVALTLYLLFPRQFLFEDPDYLARPDALSIAYLEAFLRADPDNVPVRLNLVRALSETGQLERSHQVLQPLMRRNPVPDKALDYYFELQGKRLFATPKGENREAIRDSVYSRAQQLIQEPHETKRILELLQPTKDWLQQGDYLALLEAVKQRTTSPQEQLALAREMAQLQEAQARPGAAATTLRAHIASVSPNERDAFLDNIIRLELASGNQKQALALFKLKTEGRPKTGAELGQGIQLARLAGSTSDERAWTRQRADNNPGNPAYQRELLSLQLAEGRIDVALRTVRRLQNLPRQLTPEDSRTMAQVLEWNNYPEEALPLWAKLYRDTGSEQAFTRAADLAEGLFQWDTLLALLNQRSERRTLEPESHLMLADALLRVGRFEAAITQLGNSQTLYPGNRELTNRHLQILINLRRFEDAIKLLEGEPELTTEQRVQLANLYWRTRQPEKALAILDVTPSDQTLANNVRLMRLDLANTLGKRQLLQRDYERLKSVPQDELTPAINQRMLNLAVLFEDYPHAVQLANERYSETGDPQLLIAIAEFHLALEQWQTLAKILDRWAREDASARNNTRFWSLSALVHQHNGDLQAANKAYRNAWQLTPENESLMISWAWLMLENVSGHADTLQMLLARLSGSPSPEAYPVLAFGHNAIGQPQRALHWFRKGLATHRDNIDWLIAMADLMDQTGASQYAHDLRRLAAGLVSKTQTTAANRFAVYRDTGRLKLAWRELAGPTSESNGSENNGFGESLAFFAVNQRQAQLAESLIPSRNEASRQRLLSALYPETENREAQTKRYLNQVEQLNKPLSHETRTSMLRDTVLLHQSFNQALQVGTHWQNLGNFSVLRSGVTGQFSRDAMRWRWSVDHIKGNGSGLLQRAPAPNAEATIGVDRQEANVNWSLSATILPRHRSNQLALGGSYNWAPSDGVNLGVGYHYRERTPDSAEAWWVTSRDRGYLTASYMPFSRLNLGTQVQKLRINSLDNDSLGDGHGLDLTGTYTLFRNDPAWIISASYQKQQLSLNDIALSDRTSQALEQPASTNGLLTENYERVGFSTRWFRGEPHALFRTTPSPRAFLGLSAGYVLSSSTPDLGTELGLGWRVLGDDELALSGSWSTEGLSGNGRTEFNLTYTLYLGR